MDLALEKVALVSLGGALILLAGACGSSGGSGGGGAGTHTTGSAECAQLAGFYGYGVDATCNDYYFCVSQSGCDLVISADNRTFNGTIAGRHVEVSGVELDQPVTCSGDLAQDGTLSLDCGACVVALAPSLAAVPAGACCDVVKQTCGAGQQCGYVANPDDDDYVISACQPAGTIAEGQPCEVATDSTDHCAPGLGCSGSGSCDPICLRATDCAAGSACASRSGHRIPLTGTCQPSCAPYGTACGTGRECKLIFALGKEAEDTASGSCGAVGSQPSDGDCGANDDCGPGLFCRFGNCSPFCDDDHPCPSGSSCNSFPGLDPSAKHLGFCA
jgi:hypothetical protein